MKALKMHKSGLTLADYRALCGIERAAKEIVCQMGFLRKHISTGEIYGEEFRLMYAGSQAAKIYHLSKGVSRRYDERKNKAVKDNPIAI
ncbi:hypothetical protein, partial [Candidatus Magnetobacterium casense]